MTTQPSPTDSNAWQPCSGGQFQDLSQRLRKKQARRAFMRTLGSGAAVGLTALAGVALWGFLAPTKLLCQDVLPLAQDYRNQTLSAEMMARVAEHLRACPGCRSYFQQQKPDGCG